MNSFLEGLDTWLQYIIVYGPTIVAALSSVAGVVIAIKQVIKSTSDTVAETKQLRREMSDLTGSLHEVLKENAELKAANAQLMQDIHKIYRGN